MKRILFLAVSALALAACKPTPRTAPAAKHTPPPAVPEAEAPAVTPPPAENTTAAEHPAPQAEPAESLLAVRAVRQSYSPLQPWEKKAPERSSALGVYLGKGMVLTLAEPLQALTYAELALPDGSRAVSARVVKRDEGLNLALLTTEHEEDASLFESRTALEVGAPLGQGGSAELAGLVRGLTPVHIALSVQGVNGDVPQLSLRTAAPLPEDHDEGAPVLKDGKLVGLSASYASDTQSLSIINADLIARFLSEEGEGGLPVLGVRFTPMDDPVLRRYLELPEGQGGLYIGEVLPGGAAESAGLAEGDVITAIEGMAIDSQGRCNHSLYGLHDASAFLRILKSPGETLMLTISRKGERIELPVPLNRDIALRGLHAEEASGTPPRYILWGGLLFQPLTETYLNAVRGRSNGDLPISYQRALQQEKESADAGMTELVGLTMVIPTPATLGYENSRFSVVKEVNGKPVHDFAEFERLLDEPTEDGITSLALDREPYTLYVDRAAAEAANDLMRRQGIPVLRVSGQEE